MLHLLQTKISVQGWYRIFFFFFALVCLLLVVFFFLVSVDLHAETLFFSLFHNPDYNTWDCFLFFHDDIKCGKKCERTKDNRPGGYWVQTDKNTQNLTEQKHIHYVLFISSFHPQLAVNDIAWNIFLKNTCEKIGR